MILESVYTRLLAALIAILGLIALGWYLGASHWKARYEALQAGDAQARADAMAKAVAQIQAQEAAYDAKLEEIEHDRDTKVAAATASADELARSLHDYEGRLRTCSVPNGTPGPGKPDAASQEPTSDGEVEIARREALEACASDAEQLKALQAERLSLISPAANPSSTGGSHPSE